MYNMLVKTFIILSILLMSLYLGGCGKIDIQLEPSKELGVKIQGVNLVLNEEQFVLNGVILNMAKPTVKEVLLRLNYIDRSRNIIKKDTVKYPLNTQLGTGAMEGFSINLNEVPPETVKVDVHILKVEVL